MLVPLAFQLTRTYYLLVMKTATQTPAALSPLARAVVAPAIAAALGDDAQSFFDALIADDARTAALMHALDAAQAAHACPVAARRDRLAGRAPAAFPTALDLAI